MSEHTKFELLLNTGKFSQATIAKIAGVTPQMIQKYATNKHRPGVDPAFLIAKLFEVSVEWLWCDDNNMTIEDYDKEKERYWKTKLQRM